MSGTLTCPSCRAEVHEDWRFCTSCGTERPGLYDPDPPPVAVAGQMNGSDPERVPDLDLPGGALVRWRGLDALGVFVLSLIATVVIAGIVAITLGGGDPSAAQEDIALTIGIIANQFALGGTTLLWLRRRYGVGLRALGFVTPPGKHIGMGIGAGVAGVAVSATVAAVIVWVTELVQGRPPADPEQIPLESADPATGLLVALAFSTIVFAPLAEEIFFRGMLHQAMRRWLRFVPAAIGSSVLFAVSHVIPLVIPSIFALSLVIVFVYEKSKNLWVPIIAHATFNVVGFWASFLVT